MILVSHSFLRLGMDSNFSDEAESPMSKFLLHLFAAFEEMERSIIRSVCAGARAGRAKERGYASPGAFSSADEVLSLRAEGMSRRNIVHRNRRMPPLFGKPSPATAPS